jgi:uncharacterized protein
MRAASLAALWLTLVATALAQSSSKSHAPDECSFGGDKAFDALMTSLEKAPSCNVAAVKLRRCAWGSSADTQFAPVVISKCEKTFLPKLSPSAEDRYVEEMQLCAYEESRADGTLSMSEAALCQVDIAAGYASHPEKFKDQPLRASFNCESAKTPLETAVCSHIALGHADIVLSRVYRGVLKNSSAKDRPALIRNEKDWLAVVPHKCGLIASAATDRSINCVRNEFELRFTALDDCENIGLNEGESILPCLRESTKPSTEMPDVRPRASFDCENPSDGVQLAICADSDLGQLDLDLDAIYSDAMTLLPTEEHTAMASSQQGWHKFIAKTCPLGAIGGIPDIITRGCIRDLYQKRIAQLQSCSRKESSQAISCVNRFEGLEPSAK